LIDHNHNVICGQHLYLVGPGNVGKTTVGALVADRLGRPFIDLDQEFMTRVGHIGQLIDQQGYADYRRRNSELLREIVSQADEPTVIALSSGFLVRQGHSGTDDDQSWLAVTGVTCLLLPSPDVEADVNLIADRAASRPYLKTNRDREIEKYRQRFAEYQAAGADHTVYSTEPPEVIAEQIVKKIEF